MTTMTNVVETTSDLYTVYRQSDGEEMETGFRSWTEANAWAKENLPVQAPDRWWYILPPSGEDE